MGGSGIKSDAFMRPEEITSFITGHDWTFAKTMPQNPHWYVVKEKCRSQVEFERMVIHIRRYGYREKYAGRWYTVFNWQTPSETEPYKYWTMGWPLNQTIIINRKPVSYDAPNRSP